MTITELSAKVDAVPPEANWRVKTVGIGTTTYHRTRRDALAEASRYTGAYYVIITNLNTNQREYH